MSEKQLQAAVVDCARLLGWRVYHTHDSRRSEPGFPDLVAVKGGRLIFAELKTENGKTTDAQDGWLDSLRLVPSPQFVGSPGVETYVWRPPMWASGEIEQVLR